MTFLVLRRCYVGFVAGKKSKDAVRLLCSAERQKHAPDFSIDKLQAELRSFRDNEAPVRVERGSPIGSMGRTVYLPTFST